MQLITGATCVSTEHIRPKLVSWRTFAASLMMSSGSKIMWQVCLGQRLHAALAADNIMSENVRNGLAYATDYRTLTMEQDWNYMDRRFELDDPGQ